MDLNLRHYRPWSDLSGDILSLILNNLTFADHVRFGAVCKQWNLAAASATPHSRALRLPWLVLSPDPTTANSWALFSPIERRVHHLTLPELPSDQTRRCVGSSKGWLALVAEDARLVNPFTNQCIRLPLSELVSHRYFVKVVLSSTPCLRNRDCMLAAITDFGLVFCRVGDTEWSVFEASWFRDVSAISDVIFFNGLLYCLGFEYEVIVLDVSSVPVCRNAYTAMDPVGTQGNCGADCVEQSLYLVESVGELLMVSQHLAFDLNDHFGRTTHFRVFRFDPSVSKWVKMWSLGDQMLLLGDDISSVSVNVVEFSGFGFRRNCIYFTEQDGGNNHAWHVFYLDDEKIQPFSPGSYPSVKSPPKWFMLNT